jgi:hypothetical protein
MRRRENGEIFDVDDFDADGSRPRLAKRIMSEKQTITDITWDECIVSENISDILGYWQPPTRLPGVSKVETIISTAEFLAAPYERKSGKPASALSTDSVPLVLIDFPSFDQVLSILDNLETRIETWAVSGRALRDDLRLAYIWLQVSLQYDSPNKIAGRYDHLVKIKKTAHKLRQLLAIDLEDWLAMGIDWISHPIDPLLFKSVDGEEPEERALRLLEARVQALKHPRFRYEGLVATLDHFIDVADGLAGAGSDKPLVDQPNPHENFLRGPLSTIYEKHLAAYERPMTGRASEYPATTFCHFAQAAFEMMHVNYGFDTVQRMVRDIKSGRIRRKTA